MLPAPVYSESGSRIYCKPFLPIYEAYLAQNAAVPMWSTRHIFNKEYLHVEVLVDEEVPLEKSTDDVLNMNTYTCHICDVEVPKSYITEHNDGGKHKTCLKIAELALERVRKQLQLVKEPRLSIQVAETYFCESCAAVVQNLDKIQHELSERHIKSLKHDNVFKKFLKIYEDKDNIDIVVEQKLENIVSYSIEELDEPAIVNHDSVNICNDTNVPGTETLKEVIPEPTQEKKLKSEEVPSSETPNTTTSNCNSDIVFNRLTELVSELQNSTTKMQKNIHTASFQHIDHNQLTKSEKKQIVHKASSQLFDYIKLVTDKCCTDPIHSVEVLTDKLILITAINGDKIRVPLANFHSIHNQKDKSYCKICEDPNVGYMHEHSEEHMEKVMIPIEDKDAIRKIDDIWSHCVLCNDMTKNINFHLQSLLHRNKLKHCLVANGTDFNDNILQQPNSQKEDSSRLIQEHGLIVSHNDSEITCNICDITLPNNIVSIKNHIKEFGHITKYNATIERNKLTELDDLQYYCKSCDLCVDKYYALGHCNGKKHNKHLTELINNETARKMNGGDCTQIILPSISQQIKRDKKQKRSNTDSELICFVCNIVLCSVDRHMNSLEHKKNYLSYLETNKLNEIEEDTFFCFPCNTVILIAYLMNHCTSKKHKTHLLNFMTNAKKQDYQNGNTGQLIVENSHINRSIAQSVQNASTKTIPQSVSHNSISDTAIPMKFLYQYRELSNTRNLLCIICDEEVPYKKFDIQSHVNVIDHVVAFNLMMLWNKIKRLTDKYYCDMCKVDVTYFNELSHITSASHVLVMTSQPKATVYEYDRTLLTLEYAMSHNVGDRIKPSSLLSARKRKV